MKILLFCLVAGVSYVAGVFGFAQIVGSLQNIRVRSAGATAFTIFLWVVILAGLALLVHRFFYAQRVAYYVVTGISLVQILASGRME